MMEQLSSACVVSQQEATSSSSQSSARPSCTVLWSSQTGRAKACARRTARIVRSQKHVHVMGRHAGGGYSYGCAFDDYGSEHLLKFRDVHHSNNNNSWLLLFVSTTGDGEQCDGIRQTWTALLNKSLSSTLFSGIRFALFCLGDRAYGSQFCAAGRKLAARLVQLGALPFCDVGYGDDGTPNGGVFADLDVWLEQTLLPAIDASYDDKFMSSHVPIMEEPSSLPMSPYRVNIMKKDEVSDDKTMTSTHADVEQWQQEEYHRHYNEFFSTSCPLTAYRYDAVTGRRLQSVTDDSCMGHTAPQVGTVLSNERITASDWEQDTRHLCIQVDARVAFSGQEGERPPPAAESQNGRANVAPVVCLSSLPYQAGDVATILPFNSDQEVERLFKVLPRAIRSMADHDLQITYDNESIGDAFTCWPRRCTLRGLLTYCADIHSLPEREDLRVLSRYCRVEHTMGSQQREKLLSLSETSEAALYADYILREKRCWADVLYDFDSIRWEGPSSNDDKVDDDVMLTLEALLALLPPIRPRHFSIASAPSQALLVDKGKAAIAKKDTTPVFDIDLCVAVVKGTTPLGRSYDGLCSSYLARLVPPQTHLVRLWIRPGSFSKLPLKCYNNNANHQTRFETPVLCVGAGTGIAPLRSLLLEREAVRTMILSQSDDGGSTTLFDAAKNDGDNNLDVAAQLGINNVDNILIFGCRKQQADYYYRDEWKTLVERSRLCILTAFSRDQWHKIYVQQVLRDANSGKLIGRFVLDRQGAIYIAGGAKMARAVKEEIVECLAKVVDGGEKEANAIVKKMQRLGRFSIEAWS